MTIFNKYYMIVIDQERRMVIAIGTRYSQEFKEDAVRYRLEHPEIALRKYNSMLTLIVHFYFPLNVHIYFIIYKHTKISFEKSFLSLFFRYYNPGFRDHFNLLQGRIFRINTSFFVDKQLNFHIQKDPAFFNARSHFLFLI